MEKNFLSTKSNDSFFGLRGKNLQELLVTIDEYFIEYRYNLNLPDELTFGVEIEYEGLRKRKVDRFIQDFKNWKSTSDGSLTMGGEIISPILKDKVEYWKELKKICEFLTKKNADTLNNAGGHIHIGASILGKDVEAWKTFLKLYTIYESVIFRFAYGDKISARKGMNKYAKPVSDTLYRAIPAIIKAENIYDISSTLPTDKYNALNFNHVSFANLQTNGINNTLEFRNPNATTNATIWQNNINAFAKMLLSSKSRLMDEEFLDYKLQHEFQSSEHDKYMYNEVSLKNVLEFVDLVFNNNLDKVNFLKQYLKNFQENFGVKKAVLAKKIDRR